MSYTRFSRSLNVRRTNNQKLQRHIEREAVKQIMLLEEDNNLIRELLSEIPDWKTFDEVVSDFDAVARMNKKLACREGDYYQYDIPFSTGVTNVKGARYFTVQLGKSNYIESSLARLRDILIADGVDNELVGRICATITKK